LPCYSAPTHEDRGCFPLCQRFLKFRLEVKWKGLFWSLPTGPTEIFRSVFDKPVHCPASLHLCREFGKGIKNGKNPIPLGWPGLIGKCRSIFLGYWHNGNTPYVINTILGHYVRFWIFSRKSFEARKKRLAARGSRLGLAK